MAGSGGREEPQVDRLLGSLEATFDASVARQEHEAASDLAFSLSQDRVAAEVLTRWTGARLRLPSGQSMRIAAIGRDYVLTARPTLLVPLSSLVAVAAERGPAPEVAGDTLLERLREWARRGVDVEVTTTAGVLAGRLARVGPDHVQVDRADLPCVAALGAIESVRSLRGEEA